MPYTRTTIHFSFHTQACNAFFADFFELINKQELKLDVDSRYSTLIVDDITKYYKNTKKLSVKLVDCYNNGISGEKVSI